MEVKIITLCGVKGSGKSTLGAIIKEYYEENGYSVHIVPFAESLKKISAMIVCEYTGNLYDSILEYFLNPLLKETKIPNFNLSARQLMTSFGTDYIRNIDDNFWIQCTNSKIESIKRNCSGKTLILIDDARFYNELEYSKKIGDVYFIAKSHKQAYPPITEKIKSFFKTHSSEKGLYQYCDKDDLIINDGTIQDLKHNFLKRVNI